jgi:hypothetical protein
LRRLVAVTLGFLTALGSMAVPGKAAVPDSAAATVTEPAPVSADVAALPPVLSPDRVVEPDAVLGSGWSSSRDRAVTTAGDETGLHVLVADRAEAYQWRTVATVAEPVIETDQWIGEACVTESGSRAVVIYAPRTFTNYPEAMERGAFIAVVDLDSGDVTKLAERASLAYYNPSCGLGETAVFARFDSAVSVDREATTWIGVLDAATGAVQREVTARGQLASPILAGERLIAAAGRSLVEVADDGTVSTLARTDGQAFRLMPDGARGVAFQVARDNEVDLVQFGDRGLRTVATAPLGSVKLRPGAGGQVYAIGFEASQRLSAAPGGGPGQRPVILPRSWRVIDALPDSQPSTEGLIVVERARTMRESMGAINLADVAPEAAGLVSIAARLATGDSVGFSIRADGSPAGRTLSPALGGPAIGAPPGPSAQGGGIQSAATTSWDVDPVCAVPRNHPEIQVYQPSPRQVEWAANLAVRGQLTFDRPANWLNNQLPAYSPQGYFPPVSLAGGGEVPAQVLLGILAQESNMWQASYRVVDALAGNPLISAGFYGLDWQAPDPTKIGEKAYDCGYGAAQVTTGMLSADTDTMVGGVYMSYDKQRAVVTDYATNVAAGLRILQQKWNELYHSGLMANNGDPQYIENWFMAVWAYNSGFQPDHRFGNDTGCRPSPTCTDEFGNWGVGWSNNPANPIYPADRQMFLTAPLDVPDEDFYDEIAYDNAKHPHHWSYPEKIMGWAYTSLRRYDFHSRNWVETYWTAQMHEFTADAQPDRMTFCSPAVNSCDPEVEPGQTSAPAPPCLRHDYRCWWNQPVTFTPNDCVNCGTEHRRFTTVEPRPLASSIYSTQCSTTGLPANSRIINTIDYPSPRGPNGCWPSWTKGGAFSVEFEERTNGEGQKIYPGKYNFHQIGGGFGGHFWVSETQQPTAGNQAIKVTGRWTVDPVNAWSRVFVHIPDHGAHTRQARYEITLPSGASGGHRAIPTNYQANTWVDIGVFDFTGSGNAVIELTNFTRDGGRAERIAWDAIAIQPLPAKPDHFVVAMGDSYSSGEGAGDYDFVSDQYGSDDARKNLCRRNYHTWSRKIHLAGAPAELGDLADQRHPNVDYHLIACSGARTHHLMRYGTTNAFGRSAEGQYNELSQIEQGFLNEHTTLVTLSIGGNDARFGATLTGCIMSSPFNNCSDEDFILSGKDLGEDFVDPEPLYIYGPWLIENKVKPSVEQVVQQIRQEAPNAHIQLMLYPELFTSADCFLLLSEADIEFLNDLAVTMEYAYADLNNLAGVNAMSTIADFRGNTICAEGSVPWINALIESGVAGGSPTAPAMESFHPNLLGFSMMGALISDRLEALHYHW